MRCLSREDLNGSVIGTGNGGRRRQICKGSLWNNSLVCPGLEKKLNVRERKDCDWQRKHHVEDAASFSRE